MKSLWKVISEKNEKWKLWYTELRKKGEKVKY